MNAAELITKLQALPPDMDVIVATLGYTSVPGNIRTVARGKVDYDSPNEHDDGDEYKYPATADPEGDVIVLSPI